jgi:hypothetical protein
MVTHQSVDNFENNCENSIRELSDLYPCRLPIRIKTPGYLKKSTVIVFASLEHAFMYRMIRFPVISPSDAVIDSNILQITAQDAMLFMKQFEPDGVFGSWESISKYCDIAKITTGFTGSHNVGLIARQLCSKKHGGNVIRRQIVSKALEMWSYQGSIVARSISTCLKLGRPNYSSYKAQIRRLFTKKLENNPYINNILYQQFFIITENLTFPYRVATVNRLQKHDCNSTLSTIR